MGTWDYATCEANADCRGAFGFGSVCGESGLCETAALEARCDRPGAEAPSLPIDPSTSYPIATLFDHSLETHIGRYRSAALAATQANENGGLEGREFAVVHCDNQEDDGTFGDGLDKDAATEALALYLADSVGVPVVVGPASSSRTEAAYHIASNYGALIISPSATSPSLTDLDGLSATDAAPGLLWRTAPPDSLQGQVIAEDILERGSRDVGVIYQTGAYGEGLQVVFTDAFEAAGGDATGYPFGDTSARDEAVADAGAAGFDEVLFISSDSDDVVSFLNAAALLSGYDRLPIFLTDSARNVDVLDAVSSDARNLFPFIRGTAPATPTGAVYDAFVAAYAGAYSGDDVSVLSYTAQSFDAAWLAIYGTAWAQYQEDRVRGTEIARGLRRVSSGEQVDVRPSFWNTVKASFEAGQDVDIQGASGDLDFDPSTEETTAPIDVWLIAPGGDDFDTADTIQP